MPRPFFLWFASLLLAMAGTLAPAAIDYSYWTSATSYDLAGGTLEVDVYLRETRTDDSPSLIAGVGLSGAAFRVDRVGGNGVQVADLRFNPLFDGGEFFNHKEVAPDSARLFEATFVGGVDFTTPGHVWLGTIVLEPGVGGGSTEFELSLYDEFVGNVVTAGASFTALDDPAATVFTPLQGGQRFIVNTPEPAAAGVVGIIGATILRRRRLTK